MKTQRGITLIRQSYQNPDYMVDEDGNVYSKRFPDRILKPETNTGYAKLHLVNDDGSLQSVSVHRMVAMTFLRDTYQEGYVVNHKDGNPLNNNVENLEWLSQLDNVNYSINVLNHPNGKCKKIIAINPETEEVELSFDSLADASRHFFPDNPASARNSAKSISRAKNGRGGRIIYRGYIWLDEEQE